MMATRENRVSCRNMLISCWVFVLVCLFSAILGVFIQKSEPIPFHGRIRGRDSWFLKVGIKNWSFG